MIIVPVNDTFGLPDNAQDADDQTWLAGYTRAPLETQMCGACREVSVRSHLVQDALATHQRRATAEFLHDPLSIVKSAGRYASRCDRQSKARRFAMTSHNRRAGRTSATPC